jgi:hypothetical protein
MKESFSDKVYPRNLKIGDVFSIRKTTNAKKFRVTGIVLKVCKENGFKNFHSEDHGKVLIPVDNHNSIGQLLLPADHEIYPR